MVASPTMGALYRRGAESKGSRFKVFGMQGYLCETLIPKPYLEALLT